MPSGEKARAFTAPAPTWAAFPSRALTTSSAVASTESVSAEAAWAERKRWAARVPSLIARSRVRWAFRRLRRAVTSSFPALVASSLAFLATPWAAPRPGSLAASRAVTRACASRAAWRLPVAVPSLAVRSFWAAATLPASSLDLAFRLFHCFSFSPTCFLRSSARRLARSRRWVARVRRCSKSRSPLSSRSIFPSGAFQSLITPSAPAVAIRMEAACTAMALSGPPWAICRTSFPARSQIRRLPSSLAERSCVPPSPKAARAITLAGAFHSAGAGALASSSALE